MIKINHIDHINFFVTNLKQSVAFYEKHLGFKVYEAGVGFASNNPYRILGIPGKIFICIYEQSKGVEISGYNHMGLHIEHFETALAYAKSAGLKLLYGGLNEHENSKSFYIADPDGYEIELSEKFGGDLGVAKLNQ